MFARAATRFASASRTRVAASAVRSLSVSNSTHCSDFVSVVLGDIWNEIHPMWPLCFRLLPGCLFKNSFSSSFNSFLNWSSSCPSKSNVDVLFNYCSPLLIDGCSRHGIFFQLTTAH